MKILWVQFLTEAGHHRIRIGDIGFSHKQHYIAADEVIFGLRSLLANTKHTLFCRKHNNCKLSLSR